MCGIAGMISCDMNAAHKAVSAMNAAQRHRGPDDEGIEVISIRDRFVVLGHRRLSILDLSPAGHQPMLNPNTGDWIVFNGEIYNFLELRAELERHGDVFRTHCDTEVILNAFARWDVASFDKLCGMFAFALYVAARNEVILVRDPLGIKPLYYAWRGNEFCFASEVRAIKAGGMISGEIDRRALAGMLAYGAIQEPLTIYTAVKGLPAGSWATVDLRRDSQAFSRTGRHWDFPSIAEPIGGRKGAIEKLRDALTVAAQSHLLSDVPVGLFLSSGIDSTAIAALCSKSRGNLDAYTQRLIDQPELDESADAALTAQELKLRHHILELTDAAVYGQMQAWLAAQDQPSMDGLNTYVISKAVRERGTVVALSGLGGDELFGGYPSFVDVPRMIKWRRRMSFLPASILSFGARIAYANAGRSVRQKVTETLSTATTIEAMYFRRRRLTGDRDMSLLGFEPRELNLTPEFMPPECEPARGLPPNDAAAAVSILESRFYMGNMLLRDSDVLSMAHGLELRVPLLDRRVLDFAFSLPGAMRVPQDGNGPNKALLSQAMEGLIPSRIVNLKKRGFNLSQQRWISGPLRDVIDNGINVLKRSSLVDSNTVSNIWSQFLEGNKGNDWSRPWTLGVLGAWCENHT